MRSERSLVVLLLIAGCDAPSVTAAQSARSSVPTAASQSLVGRPELVVVPEAVSSGREFVKQELARAKQDNKKLVIYVGGESCEPCRRFHEAVQAGKLDRELAGVRFLDFDIEEHGPLLADADMACTSKLVPLFALPTEDGTCSDRRTEGGIKGDRAVGFILPRLQAIL